MNKPPQYSASVRRRYKIGDQFGRIHKSSKTYLDLEVVASDGSAVPAHLYEGLELLSAAKLMCKCLNAGLTLEQANFVDWDWSSRCKESVELILKRAAQ